LTRRRTKPVAKARGRRPKILDESLRTKIVTLVAAGAYAYVAAGAVGIARSTLYEWLARGEAGEEPYRSFRDAVAQAHASRRAALEVEVAKADPKFWLTHVARDKPGEPGWSDRTEITGTDGGPVQVEDPYDVLLRRLERLPLHPL